MSKNHSIVHASFRGTTLPLAILFVLFILTARLAHTQTLTVLHDFSGGTDGAYPEAGLTIDSAGNFYGTTTYGGIGYGTVFKLKRAGSGWVLTPIYTFSGGSDGSEPWARVVFGPDGTLYGTTAGGGSENTGVVFRLTPPPTACHTVLCPWSETVLHSFTGRDGQFPGRGDLTFDSVGNIYGTTIAGGLHGNGAVFELSPSAGGWTENVLYSFNGPPDGASPYSAVIFDGSETLYGTTSLGGNTPSVCGGSGCGTVYQLTSSGSGWTENVLYRFENGNDGAYPLGGLILGPSGQLYGTTSVSNYMGGGTAFQLTGLNNVWQLQTLANLGSGALAGMVMDRNGNLYVDAIRWRVELQHAAHV